MREEYPLQQLRGGPNRESNRSASRFVGILAQGFVTPRPTPERQLVA